MSAVGPRVELLPLSLDHLDGVMSWVNDHEVMQYFANRQTDVSREEETLWLERFIASSTDRAWSIFVDGAYAGQCSLNQIYWPARNARLFLVVNRHHQGKGIGPRALELLIQRAFDEAGLHKIWLIVRRDNRRAQAMYLKAGFDFEGVLPDEYRVGDTWFDMVRMSIRNLSRSPAQKP